MISDFAMQPQMSNQGMVMTTERTMVLMLAIVSLRPGISGSQPNGRGILHPGIHSLVGMVWGGKVKFGIK